MKIRFTIIFFAVFLFSKFSYSQSIPLRINEDGYIFVNVTINDSVNAEFILDTGGGMNVLSNKIYQKIKESTKFHSYETGFRHDGERLDGVVYEVPSLKIGNYKLNNVTAGMYAPLDEYGIDGIISLKFFEDMPFTIDFKNQTLKLENRKSINKIRKKSEVTPVFFITHTDYSIDMFLNLIFNDSVTVKAEFDTGNGYYGIVANPYYMPLLGIDTNATQRSNHITPITKTSLRDYYVRIPSLKFEGINSAELKNETVVFRQNMIHQALIGSQMFKDKAITIDIQNKKMYVR